jgi:hypothetical protein
MVLLRIEPMNFWFETLITAEPVDLNKNADKVGLR